MSVSRLRPVVRFALPIVALAAGVAVAVGLVSCGSRDEKGLLPGDNAREIVANLNQVQEDAANGDCTAAAGEVAAIQDDIARLPDSVDSELRARLEGGARQLADLVNSPDACVTSTTTEETTTQETTEPTTTKKTTTTTSTTSTTTATTPTTTTTTAPTTGEGGGVGPAPPTAPPDQSGNGTGTG
jgi:hypothetical protein